MPGKRSKKAPQDAGEKKPKIAVVTRQQVLPTETLEEVFASSERYDLDNWSVVSRQYIQAIRPTKPLRTVKEVAISFDAQTKAYKTVFFYEDPDKEGSMLELTHRSGDPADPSHLAAFIKLIRFCFVDGPLKIDRMCMNIDREFLKSLKSIKDDFLVTDSLLALNWHYSDHEKCTTEELLDALCAFPLRALNKSTFDFVRARRGYLHHEVVDGFLQMLASRGIFCLGDVTGQPDRFDNGIEGENVTEDEILDYCFGDYDDGGKGRLLHISRPQLSPKFVPKLIEACRASKSNHKLKLMITKNFIEGVEREDVVPNGEEFSGPRGARWELSMDDLSLRIAFYPPNQRHTRYMNGLILCERNVPGSERYY